MLIGACAILDHLTLPDTSQSFSPSSTEAAIFLISFYRQWAGTRHERKRSRDTTIFDRGLVGGGKPVFIRVSLGYDNLVHILSSEI